jgi:hypothetical protein
MLEPLLSSTDKEKTLLDAAALTALYLRSGQAPVFSSHPPLNPAPDMALAHDPVEATNIFNTVEREQGELWTEWLDLSIKHKVPPPPRTLHRLLELGKSATMLRERISQVIGARGHWLGKFMPEASWLIPEELPKNVWEEGSLPERIAYLFKIRNANPEQARTMLIEIWKQENAEARTSLLETLRTNLSLSDEPFLETCLDDKSKRVRELAVDFLSGLPDSSFTKRMIERTKPFLSYKPSAMLGLKKASLEISLPESYDQTWARDGIEQKGMPYNMGEKVWWVKQMLERTPPSTWGQPEILSAVPKEWHDVLYDAFRVATLRFADRAWAYSFLPDEAMVCLLPVPERQTYVLDRLSNMQGPLLTSDSLWNMLIDLPKPWSVMLEENLMKRAQLSLLSWSKTQGYSWYEQTSLIAFAKHLPVTFLQRIPPAVAEKFKAPDHPLHEAFIKMASLIELRVRMHGYFSEV